MTEGSGIWEPAGTDLHGHILHQQTDRQMERHAKLSNGESQYLSRSRNAWPSRGQASSRTAFLTDRAVVPATAACTHMLTNRHGRRTTGRAEVGMQGELQGCNERVHAC